VTLFQSVLSRPSLLPFEFFATRTPLNMLAASVAFPVYLLSTVTALAGLRTRSSGRLPCWWSLVCHLVRTPSHTQWFATSGKYTTGQHTHKHVESALRPCNPAFFVIPTNTQKFSVAFCKVFCTVLVRR
jgi:hypothetical protein